MAKRTLAWVFGGGGARGALQVGAARALLEAGIQPDLLVGTSIGACNAAYLALTGVNLAGVDRLETVWRDAETANLLPPNYLWVTFRSLFRRQVRTLAEQRLRNFYISHGIDESVRADQVLGVRLLLVASDINSGRTVLFGAAPEDSIFEGVMASSALPPWIRPQHTNGRVLVDGGLLSTLPIEPALNQGATEIIALDLNDPLSLPDDAPGLRPGMVKVANAIQQRQLDLELALAASQGISVRRIQLRSHPPVPIWDFARTRELVSLGYDITRAALEDERPALRTRWWTPRDWWLRTAERRSQRGRAA